MDIDFLNERDWQKWITAKIIDLETELKELRQDLKKHVDDEAHDFGTIKAHVAEIVDWLKSIDK